MFFKKLKIQNLKIIVGIRSKYMKIPMSSVSLVVEDTLSIETAVTDTTDE